MIGSDEVIRGRLGCGIWTIGRVRSDLTEGGVIGVEGAENLICGNVKETKVFAISGRKVRPKAKGGGEEAQGADNVGLKEWFGRINGTVDMTFGGEIDDSLDLVLGQQATDKFLVRQVAVNENISGIILKVRKVLGVSRISHFV